MYELKNTLEYPENLLANIRAYKFNMDPQLVSLGLVDRIEDKLNNILDSLKYCWCINNINLDYLFSYFLNNESIDTITDKLQSKPDIVVNSITNIIKVLSLDFYYDILFEPTFIGDCLIKETYIGVNTRLINCLARYRNNFEFKKEGIKTLQDIKVLLARHDNDFNKINIRGIGPQSKKELKLLVDLFDKYYTYNIILLNEEECKDEEQDDIKEDITINKENELKNEIFKLKEKVNLLEIKNLLNDYSTSALVVSDLKTDKVLKVARKDLIIEAIDLLLDKRYNE